MMNIITEIERLLDDPGSSAMIREKLFLLKDQFIAFENQSVICKTTVMELNLEISHLSDRIKKLQTENEALKTNNEILEIENSKILNQSTGVIKQNEQINKKELHENHLDKIKEKILELLASKDLSTEEFVSLTGVEKALVELHLHELADSKHIGHQFGVITIGDNSPIGYWYIEHKGRKHLAINGFLK